MMKLIALFDYKKMLDKRKGNYRFVISSSGSELNIFVPPK